MSVYRPESVSLYPGRENHVIVEFPARARLAVAAKLEAAKSVIDGVLMDFPGADCNPEPSFGMREGYATFNIFCTGVVQAARVIEKLRSVYNVAA